MIVIKVNYSSDAPIIKVNYDDAPIYISTTVDATYIKVDYGTGSGGAAVWGLITGNLSDQTDLQNAFDDKVPYTGATGDVDLGEYELKAGQVEFDQSPTGTAGVGVMRWNNTDGTLDLGLKGGSVTLQVGEDIVARVVNKTGGNLLASNYQVVKVSSAQGQRLAVTLAQGNNDNNSADTLGLVIENINNNQEGWIQILGQLTEVNTTGSLQGETWTDGDVLYLSPTTAGALTNVKPVAPQHIVVLGYVEYAHSQHGKIYVKVMNGWELGELHDVDTTGATDGQVLSYNAALGIWKPVTNAAGNIYTTDGTLTGNRTVTMGGNTINFTGGFFGINNPTPLRTLDLISTQSASYVSVASFMAPNNAISGNTTQFYIGASQSVGNSISWTFRYDGSNSALNRMGFEFNGYATPVLSMFRSGNSIFGGSTDAGYKLDVQGTTRITGNTIIGASTLGQLLTFTTFGNYAIGVQSAQLQLIVPGTGQMVSLGYGSSASFTSNLDVSGNSVIVYPRLQANNIIQSNYFSGLDPTVGGGAGQQIAYYLDAANNYGQGISTLYTGNKYDVWYQVGAVNGGGFRWYRGTTEQFRTTINDNVLIGTSTDVTSSILTIASTTKGFLQPRMTTTQRNAISTPATGLSIYNTTTNTLDYYNGTSWVSGQTSITTGNLTETGSSILTISGGTNAVIGSGTTIQVAQASGSTNGFLSSTDWTTFNNKQNALTNPITGTGTSGQVAYWSGTNTQTGSNNLFWNNSTTRLGVGTNLPYGRFHSTGIVVSSTTDFVANTTGSIVYMRTFASTGNTIGLIGAGSTGDTVVASLALAPFGGNVILGTTSDSGQRLQVNGTALFTGSVTGTGNSSTYTVTASSGVARSKSITSTLVAAANNDVLVGLDIAPTFTNGAFTGVSNYALRLQTSAATNAWNLYASGTADNYLAGALGIGTTSNLSNCNLVIGKAIFGSTSSVAVNQVGVVQSSVTANAIGYYNSLNTAATAFTLANYYHFYGQQSTIGAGSSVTNQTVFFVDGSLTGATNNFAFRSTLNSGTGRWNLYMDGTANNYMAGSLGVGSTSLTEYNLRVSKNITGATIAFGIAQSGIVQSGVTTAGIGYYNGMNIQAAAFTVPTYTHYYTEQVTIGAGSTVTTQRGFFADSTLIGATNNFGFVGAIPAGTGRWNLYMNGTAANYLNGNLLIGTTTDGGQKLQVNGTTQMTPAADASALTISGYSVTGSGATNGISLTGTWNTTGAPTVIFTNITNTASASASTLIDLRVGNVSRFNVRASDGAIFFGVGGTAVSVRSSSGTLDIRSGLGNTAGNEFEFSNGQIGANKTTTSGTTNVVLTAMGFAPTSGTGIFNAYVYNGTINQTGGANGITRGLYINPTLTSAADWRAIEVSSGGAYINTTSVNASAILQADSTTKGFLPPRMTTTQKNAIATPAAGLIVFDTTLAKLCVYSGTAWETITSI